MHNFRQKKLREEAACHLCVCGTLPIIINSLKTKINSPCTMCKYSVRTTQRTRCLKQWWASRAAARGANL